MTAQLVVGSFGYGAFTLDGGTVNADKLLLTNGANSVFTFNRGTLTTSGATIANGQPVTVGSAAGEATWTHYAGTHTLQNALGIGTVAGAVSTLNVNGGTSSVPAGIVLGTFNCAGSGVVSVAGGSLYVTNTGFSGVLEVRSGTLSVNAGVLWVDNLVITNACGRFVYTGGIKQIGGVVLGTNMDADGDGLPNGWEMNEGLDPLIATGNDGPDGDPDGDGFTNLQEYLAGTKPKDANSLLRITKIVREGNDVRIYWQTAGGRTNRVQATAGGSGGSYSNNFVDITPDIIIPGSGDHWTNWPEPGGATNKPARYYRVRLVTPP
jgi:hypothetical protein